jgi:leucyl-tRNA synthetase
MDFKKIEAKWQKYWEENGWYPAEDFVENKEQKYILVEFPYPSGEGLHIGHAFTMTGADVYARYNRMAGYNVLFPMGWDAFGLPTENYAIKTGIPPQQATKENTDNYRRQMKKMAFSFDWSREINTTDADYYQWTQWIFIQLYKQGLAYKEEKPINWCPECKIGLANEEVIDGKCERCGAETTRRNISQWIVKITDYADKLITGLEEVDFIKKVEAAQLNWIGRSKGAKVKFSISNSQLSNEEIEVFTTRPDTLWGATFMVVAPEHQLTREILNPKSEIRKKLKIENSKIEEIEEYIEQARNKSELERAELQKEKTGVFTGLYAINPVTEEKIPIWISDFVLATYGTGAIMGVPAHDERDYQFAKKFDLPITPVVEPLEEEWNFDQEPYINVDKGKAINSGPINGLEPKPAIEKTIEILEDMGVGKEAVDYHLRDWIFSRQHYWGEPIPMIFCPACAKDQISKLEALNSKQSLNLSDPKIKQKVLKILNFEDSDLFKVSDFDIRTLKSMCGWQPVDEEDLPIKLPKVDKYEPTDTGESPLANIDDWVKTKCPECGGPAKRETDTMPNWAGSDWYYLSFLVKDKFGVKSSNLKKQSIFKECSEEINYWMPVDVYIGGDEHNTLHMLYSRFIYQFLHDIGHVPEEIPEPYYHRISHGVILGEDGQRMSKSKGNVIIPDEVWKEHGVDALRTYLMFMGPFTGTMAWNENAFRGVVRFLDKFQSAVSPERCQDDSSEVVKAEQTKIIVNKTIKRVTEDIQRFSFNTAIAAMMECLNNFQKSNVQCSKEDKKKLVKLIAPFAPYLAEELWFQLNSQTTSHEHQTPNSVHWGSWPEYDEKFLHSEEVEIPVQVNGKLRGAVTVKSEKSEDRSEVIEKAKKVENVARYLQNKKIRKVIFIPGELVNFVV